MDSILLNEAWTYIESIADTLGVDHDADLTQIVRKQMLELERAQELLQQIAEALGTGERGYDLVEVARDAHHAEMRGAALEMKLRELLDE